MIAPKLRPISTVHSPLLPISTVHLHLSRTEAAMSIPAELRVAESLTLNYSDAITESLDDLPDNFIITDPYISDHPIVFASHGFLSMTGYSRHDLLGRNPRLLQGPATDRRSVMEIREAVRAERTLQINLLNYRKDGTPHWVLLHLCPVREESTGCVIHFLAVQVPIGREAGSRRTGPLVLGSCREELVRCVSVFDDMDSRGRHWARGNSWIRILEDAVGS